MVWFKPILIFLFVLFLSQTANAQDAPKGNNLATHEKFTETFSENEILTRLPNGLTVYILKDTRFPLALTRLYVHTGSSNERPEQAGISHVLEHMVFKGTTKRPKGQVAKEVESLGGYLNAATSFDRTWYLTDMPKAHWKTGLDVVYDMAFQAILDPKELEAEKDVIISELQGDRDNPGRHLFEELQTAALEHTVYGRPIIGFEKTIRSITSKDLKDYRDYWYQPQNMQVLVAGDIDPQEVFAYVREIFEPIKNTHTLTAKPLVDLEKAPSNLKVEIKKGPWQKVYLGLTFPGPSSRDLRSVDLDVLAYLLSGDGTSKFFKTYQYDQQLVDSISFNNMNLARGGLIAITVVLDPDKLQAFWEAFTRDLANLKAADFNEASLKRAILNLEDSVERVGETLNGLVAWKSTVYFLLGGLDGKINLLNRIKNVDWPELDQAIKTWLDPNKLCVRVMAPENAELPDFRAILAKNWSALSQDQAKAKTYLTGDTEVINLEHGCKLILVPDTNAPYVSFNMIGLGSNALLTPKEQGLSQLTASLLSDGVGDLDAQALERYLAERAASLNFSSNRQSFTLKLDGPSKFIPDFLDLIEKSITQPRFEEKELKREKINILAAIKARADQPLSYLFAKLAPFIYADNHCYGFDNLGTPELINSFTVEDVRKFWAKQQEQPWILAVAGSFVKDEIVNQAKKLAARHYAPKVQVQTPTFAPDKTLDLKMPGRAQAHLVKVFPTVPSDHPDAPALMLLNTILSGQSGLLFSTMRDEQGLGYSVTTVSRFLPKTGALIFYIGTVPEKMKQADEGFFKAIQKVTVELLDPKLLEAASNRLQGSYVRENQSLGSRAKEVAGNAILDYPLHFRKILLDQAAKITPEQLREVAKKYLQPERAYTATLQP